MKHTHSELAAITTGLIMDDGLTAVVGAIVESLLNARDCAIKDYERHNLRSSKVMADAWQADAELVSTIHKIFQAQMAAGNR